MSSSEIGVAQSGSAGPSSPAGRVALRPAALASRLVGDLGHLAPVVARVGDEVLEDHLLDVAVALVDLGQRLERGDPLLLGLADPDEDPARERDPQLAGRLDRLAAARAGCLVGEPAWTVSISRSEIDSSISPCEAVTSRSRAEVRRGSATPRFVCGSSPRSSARSHAQTT